MTPATIYRRAAKRLYTHGWRQGGYGNSFGPNCALGAVWYVSGINPGYWDASNFMSEYEMLLSANDAPDTTRDDMAMLLLLAAEVVR